MKKTREAKATELLKKLETAQDKYAAAIGEAERAIADSVLFDFGIGYQHSDGWVLLGTDNADNAPLITCLDIINKIGILTYDDYKRIRI